MMKSSKSYEMADDFLMKMDTHVHVLASCLKNILREAFEASNSVISIQLSNTSMLQKLVCVLPKHFFS